MLLIAILSSILRLSSDDGGMNRNGRENEKGNENMQKLLKHDNMFQMK